MLLLFCVDIFIFSPGSIDTPSGTQVWYYPSKSNIIIPFWPILKEEDKEGVYDEEEEDI